jgi:Glycosyl hydrolases family 25
MDRQFGTSRCLIQGLLALVICTGLSGCAKNESLSPVPGIDISHYQGTVNWDQIKKDGIQFVYIKATQGEHYVDKLFEKHKQGAQQAKLLHGYYHFFEPDADPKKPEYFSEFDLKPHVKLLS